MFVAYFCENKTFTFPKQLSAMYNNIYRKLKVAKQPQMLVIVNKSNAALTKMIFILVFRFHQPSSSFFSIARGCAL